MATTQRLEDWHYEFKAYMRVQDFYSTFHPQAAESPTLLTVNELLTAASSSSTTAEAKELVQLDHNLKHALICTTTASAATLCFSAVHLKFEL